MATTERLKDFPAKTTPTTADIVYVGNAADSDNEVQCTIAEMIAAYPALASIGQLTTVADRMIYTTASNVYDVTVLTAFARTLLDDASASNARSTLGLVIGTDVQAFNAALASIAGLTTAANNLIFTTASNTYAVIASAANSVLVTSAGSVPSLSTVLPGGLTTTDPTLAQGIATKNYVDTTAQGFNVINGVDVATTGALTVTYSNGASGVGATLTNAGAQAALQIDGVSLSVGQRVLVKDQASTFQNGIYTVTNIGSGATNWVMTRATDYNTAAAINPGDYITVRLGTSNAGSSWLETATVVTIGTDAISFSVFFQPSSFLQVANNLSDVANLTTTLTNLGGGAAPTGTGALVRQTSPSLTTPALGVATATSLNFGASATNGLIGVTGGTAAAAGVVGEIISSAVAYDAVSLSTGVGNNITSISLTAGQWDIFGFVTFVPNGATTFTGATQAGINTVSATLPNVTTPAIATPSVFQEQFVTTGKACAITLPAGIVNISSTTTYFLIAQPNFGVSTMNGGGYIVAVRRR